MLQKKLIYQKTTLEIGRLLLTNVRSSFKNGLAITLLLFGVVHSALANSAISSPSKNSTKEVKQISIKGKVTDANGLPLPGADVIEKGTTNGTMTDLDGNFSIKIKSQNPVLVFSYLGYVTKEVPVGNQTNLTIILSEDSSLLSEVVVVGYGNQSKQAITGSIGQVDMESINQRPVTDLNDFLQGSLSGVSVIKNGGSPTSQSALIIRGLSTINNNNPLIVVDGIISSFGAVNPNDIESVSILKDAAAASIYGARAAGGVVLIETKKGKAGKMAIQIDSYIGFSQVDKSRLPNLLDANQYADVRILAAQNGGTTPLEAHDPLLNPKNRITRTDWLDAIFRTAITQNYSISLSGGSEKSNYYSSIRYNKTEGTQLNTYSKQVQLRLKSEHDVSKYVKVGQNFAFEWDQALGTDQYRTALYYPRSASVYYSDGSFGGVTTVNDPFGGAAFPDLRNPVATLLRGNAQGPGNNDLQLNAFIEVKPIDDLTIKSLIGYGRSNFYTRVFSPKVPEPGLPNATNSLYNLASVVQNTLWETTVKYDVPLPEKHNVDVMVGYTTQKGRNEFFATTASNFVSEDVNAQYLNFAQNVVISNVNGSFGEEGLASYLARINYNYDDKYFFTSSIRRDGTSRLQSNKRWGLFPSLSGAWIFSKENFFPQSEVFTFGKLRLSWGEIGNISALNQYPSSANVVATTYPSIIGADPFSNITPALALDAIVNDDLTWETVTSTNFGLDLRFLNDKLSLTTDYFIKETKDMIVQPRIVGTAGVSNAPFLNVGNVENKGFEIDLGFADTKGDFSYSINANFSKIDNKVTSLGTSRELSFLNNNVRSTLYPVKAVVGQPVFNYYVVPTDGIFQTDAEANAYVNASGNKIQPAARAGDLKFIDTNGDGFISDNDRVYGGDPFPDFTYGFNVNLNYKGIGLGIIGQGVQNVDLFAGYKLYSQNAALFAYNHTTDILNAWSPTNTSSNIPIVSTVDNNKNFTTTSDYYIEDGSYMRIKNISLSYDLPSSILDKLNVSRLRIYATGENLFTFTNYKGSDPELGLAGIDTGRYPVPRTYTFGVNINF